MKKYYALLTGTINSGLFHNVQNTICDTQVRLEQYDRALRLYITESVFTDIVFAENSGYPIDEKKYIEMAEACGKRFEYIHCQPHIEDTIRYGKGYGESLILQEALDSSRLLQNAEEIYKVTGRIFLHNSKQIVKARKAKNEFLIVDSLQWCYTHLFKFNKLDFIKFLYDSDLLIKEHPVSLEAIYYNLLFDAQHKGLSIACFRFWPDFDGIQGTTGFRYRSSFKGKIYHNLLCFFNGYTFHSKLQKYIRG